MSTPVKWFTSDMLGAPQIQKSGSDLLPGTLISVLDACLLNGFNAQGLDSLTYDSAAGEATGTVAAGHGFLKYQVILIEGANEAAFNGEQRITFVDTTTFKFIPTQIPPATATGTITAKAAPIGQWEKAFSGTNKAAYRSTDPLATRFYLRLDDTATDNAKAVSGYESMTDVDTGANPFGYSSYFSGSYTSTPSKWALMGDARLFYFYLMDTYSSSVGGAVFFGDINSFKPADAYHCVLIANADSSNGSPYSNAFLISLNETRSTWHIARSYNSSTLNPLVSFHGPKLLIPNPNPSDGQFYINDSPILVVADNDLRGTLPGVGLAHNELGAGFNILDGASNSTDAFLGLQTRFNTIIYGQAAFNLTGAWR